MPGSNHIKKYSSDDIERYVSGKMTPAEMYALEKDMQDDPFLAEAVEGYMTAPAPSVTEPMQELSRRLTQKTEKKIVSLPPSRKNRWLAVAAAILLVLGSGATWFLLNPGSEKNIAQHKQEDIVADSVPPPPEVKDTEEAKEEQATAIAEPENSSPEEKKTPSAKADNTADVARADKPSPVQVQPATRPAAEKKQEVNQNDAARSIVSAPVQASREAGKAPSEAPGLNRQAPKEHIAVHIFSGTVTDVNNKPLPFVNISAQNANINTYTDAGGHFRIIAGDSSLDAHIKSVGYEEKNIRLVAAAGPAAVKLDASGSSLQEVVVVGYGSQKKKSLTGNAKKQDNKQDSTDEESKEPEAEPSDGWANYDIYLLNNVRLTGNFFGYVDVSFMITPTGHIYDIRVDHSTCPGCNREAIRLIKEGPAWKLRNSVKPIRTTVTIQF
ncbi:MAG: carboxypeptidase-like regulatory domain-containing protein [Chitinophagaceae bacterium]|nr:carboxypeptidase-like regulatory domain-containing protein [Chitinophagaceae bacterium]MCW5926752.1 carboxypeptidase-like regulatory domain-containing protein [Chitinophagaceae bacterium]